MMLSFVIAALAAPSTVIYADRVYPVSSPMIADGFVRIEEGRIVEIGSADAYRSSDEDIVLRCTVLTPGLVDARATVGLTGQYNIDHDQDMLEHSNPIQPELRAIDAYNTQERLVEWVREFGTTTVHTGHAPGELVSGRTMICKTNGTTVEDAIIRSDAMVACTLGEGALKKDGKSPGTRSKSMALLRQKFIDAKEYADKFDRDAEDKEPKKRDLQLEALVNVLNGEMPLLVHANRTHDIMNALRLREEFEIDIVLDGGAEAYRLIDEIRESGVPVIVHPQMIRMYGEMENAAFTTASLLSDAGIPIAIQTGYESYVPKVRVLVFEASQAAAHGLGFDRALQACTLDAARLLNIDDRVGSLDIGKDADLAMWDGDPFEWTTHCTGVLIDGEHVSTTVR